MTARSPNSWTGYAPLDANAGVQFQAAVSDIREGLRRRRSWSYLAVENVKNRYRRTVLGPWWLTLQMVILIVGLSIVFGQLLNTDLRSFLPYVGLGYIVFSLLSGLTSAAAVVFIAGSSTLKSTRQPLSNLVLRDVGVEFINFAHNMVIYLVFLVIGLVPLSPKILIALLIVVVIAANGLFLGLWLGIAVARFRDLQPFVTSILGVAIFFCPVFYQLDSLSSGDQKRPARLEPLHVPDHGVPRAAARRAVAVVVLRRLRDRDGDQRCCSGSPCSRAPVLGFRTGWRDG